MVLVISTSKCNLFLNLIRRKISCIVEPVYNEDPEIDSNLEMKIIFSDRHLLLDPFGTIKMGAFDFEQDVVVKWMKKLCFDHFYLQLDPRGQF